MKLTTFKAPNGFTLDAVLLDTINTDNMTIEIIYCQNRLIEITTSKYSTKESTPHWKTEKQLHILCEYCIIHEADILLMKQIYC